MIRCARGGLIRAAACVRAHVFCQLDDEWLLTVVPEPRAHASLFSSELARALSKLVNMCYSVFHVMVHVPNSKLSRYGLFTDVIKQTSF